MEGKCYNCNHKGEYEWYWLITDSKDETVCHATLSMSPEESDMGDTHTEVYVCSKCLAEQ